MSQPPPAPGPPGHSPGSPPAAPTQIVYPGQLQYLQQQAAVRPQVGPYGGGGPLASGFPNYRSPAPSPPNRTSLVVGGIAVAAVVVFAVIGFLLVAGRGPGSPEAAVTAYVDAVNDRDAEQVHELLCSSAAGRFSVEQIRTVLNQQGGVGDLVTGLQIGDAQDAFVDGVEGSNVPITYTLFGVPSQDTVFVVDEDGSRICGGGLATF